MSSPNRLSAVSEGQPATRDAAGNAPVDLLNINEVATTLRVSKMTVYRFIRDGRLPAVRIGNSLRVYRGDLDTYLSAAFLPASGVDSGSLSGEPLSD